MDLSKYIAKSRIIEIKSADFEGAIKEMLDAVPSEFLKPQSTKEGILKDVVAREKNMPTYLGGGVLMPHAKAQIKSSYVFVVGMCPNGISFDTNRNEYSETRLIFLLLANGVLKNYLNTLSTIAKLFAQPDVHAEIFGKTDFAGFKESIWKIFGKKGKSDNKSGSGVAKMSRVAKRFLSQAMRIAKTSKSTCVMLFGDTFPSGVDTGEIFGGLKTLIVTERSAEDFPGKKTATISIKSYSGRRMTGFGSAIIMGLTKGLIERNEKICCIGGIKDSKIFDTVVVVDIAQEFSKIMNLQSNLVPAGVKPEVVERVLIIASDLSVEGREGKPVGCLFVVGDAKKIRPFTKQLILNPFYGYKPEERNILSPFMDETVKELSLIDGAVIIDGSGAIESAGTLIHTPDFNLKLPGGLGARHAAAYSVSVSADCLAFVVSSSTGIISVFRNGQMLPLNEKNHS